MFFEVIDEIIDLGQGGVRVSLVVVLQERCPEIYRVLWGALAACFAHSLRCSLVRPEGILTDGSSVNEIRR